VRLVERALKRLKAREAAAVRPIGTLTPGLDESGSLNREPAREEARSIVAPPSVVRYSEPRPKVVMDRGRLKEEGFLASDEVERVKAEEYRRIKRPLLAHAFGIDATQIKDGTLVLISSALAGEGKTHTCINLALSLAMEKDRTVLLIDGDVPKPHLSRMFGVANEPGLLDALADEAIELQHLLIRTDLDNLRILPAGHWHPHATELLASERMLKLCQELASRYPDRIILFDSPPLLAASEAQAIAAAVGQVVLVVAEGLTPRDAVRDALSLIAEDKPVNAILNKCRRTAGSGYYSGYYQGYGDRESTSNVPSG
jgi:protein-tyrosine kinase